MPITVVTARDYEGVRTAREVYAEADTFTVTEDGLRLLAANDDLLALYPSGSWLSVFVDDPMPAVGAPPATTHHEATAPAASVRGLPPMAEPTAPEGVPGRRERTPDPTPPGFRTVRFAPKLAGDRPPAPPDEAPRPRMLRVSFSPKVYRAARQDRTRQAAGRGPAAAIPAGRVPTQALPRRASSRRRSRRRPARGRRPGRRLARLLARYAWPWRSKTDPSAYDIEIDGVRLQEPVCHVRPPSWQHATRS